MSDLVGNPEDRFSRVEAHLIEDEIHALCKCKKFDTLRQDF